ncbi:MAG TPA: BON domain-containing protein [Pyrinomonadaceae bacterium]
MKVKLYSLGLGMILAALVFSACGGTESNGVVNSTNANRSNNPNTASVVNANNSTVVSTTNNATTTNRWANANGVTREQYDKERADYEREKGTSTIGQGANDSWIWFKTRAALLGTSDLRESTVNVDVANDVVTLKGTVETAAQKTKAEQVAKGIDGVKSVKNELKVAPNDSMANMSSGNSGNTKSANANANKR